MKSKEVLKILRISRPTLTNYVKNGKLKATKLNNGYYDYDSKSVFDLISVGDRVNVAYCRVSTKNQKKDLGNQIDFIQNYCVKNGIILNSVFSDISSGMTLDRKNFNVLLEDVMNYKINIVYITYKDRISRLSFSTIQNLFLKFGTKIVIVNEIDCKKTVEKELLEDLISLLHTFSMNMYSNRRKKKLSLFVDDLKFETDSSNL